MKKKAIVFIFLTFTIVPLIMLYTDKKIDINDQASSIIDDKVIKYMNADMKDLIKRPNDYNIYYLLFDDYQLSTKNIEKIFTYFDKFHYEYRILTLYPYINPLYATILSNLEKISYNNLDHFYQIYRDGLEKQSLDGEIIKIDTSGIAIRMVKIDTSNLAMYHFLKQYKDIKYNLSSSGIFKKF